MLRDDAMHGGAHVTRTFWIFALCSIFFAACRPDGGTKQPSEDSSLCLPQPFPAQDRLDAIAAGPPPAPAEPMKYASVDTWTLQGKLPMKSGATPATTTEATTLAKILGPERPVTEQMSCFAREVGGFTLAHADEPPPELVAWIAARCGVGHVGANLLIAKPGPVGAGVLDAERDRGPILDAASSVPGPADFGIGLVEHGKSVTAFIAAAPRKITLAEVPMIPQNGRVVVAGESAAPIGWIRGHVTLGEDGVGRCAPVAAQSTSPQAFALSCAVDQEDPSTTIEIIVGPPGTIMGNIQLSVWASPDASLGSTWTAHSIATPVGGAEVDALAWLSSINAIRERNRLAPWSLAKAQSDMLGALTPHLFDAHPSVRDEVALGILAGWKVEGSIRNADLQYFHVPSGVPLARSFGAAMTRPAFRALVMSDNRDVGAVSLRAGTLGADRLVVAGYGLFNQRDYLMEEEAFLDQLDAHRTARNLPPVERVGGPKDRKLLRDMADRVRNGESEPMDELEELLEHFMRVTGHRMRGAIFTTLTLDGFRPDFHDVLATATGVVAMVKIADWRPPGSAWGQQIIYVVYTVPGDRG
jgi:hypothetical protein